MRTTEDVANQMAISGDLQMDIKILKEYVSEVIDEILQDPSMIYYDDGECAYDYEKFYELKRKL